MIDEERNRNENNLLLSEWGIVVNEFLPKYYGAGDSSPRTSNEVASRAVILTYVVGITLSQPSERLLNAICEFRLNDSLSVEETQLFRQVEFSQQQLVDAEWVFEHLLVFAWCLGRENIDPFITDHIEPSLENADLFSFFPKPFSNPTRFIEDSVLRPVEELYLMADRYYRLHWATVENQLRPHNCPLEESVIRNRRRALDWTIGTAADWDNVPADT